MAGHFGNMTSWRPVGAMPWAGGGRGFGGQGKVSMVTSVFSAGKVMSSNSICSEIWLPKPCVW